MTKYDLKDGMVVESREGKRYLVLNGKLKGTDTYYGVSDLRDDLTYSEVSRLDVMRVYSTEGCTLNSIFSSDNLNLIWTRKKAIEVGSIVKVVRRGERYTLYNRFFENNDIDRGICTRYRYDDDDTFKDSDRFKVLKVIDDYVIIERRSINKPVYLFNLRGLEVVD